MRVARLRCSEGPGRIFWRHRLVAASWEINNGITRSSEVHLVWYQVPVQEANATRRFAPAKAAVRRQVVAVWSRGRHLADLLFELRPTDLRTAEAECRVRLAVREARWRPPHCVLAHDVLD